MVPDMSHMDLWRETWVWAGLFGLLAFEIQEQSEFRLDIKPV